MVLTHSDRIAETRRILGKFCENLSDEQVQRINDAIEAVVAFGLKGATEKWKDQLKS